MRGNGALTMDSGFTPGEAGGAFAGLVALFYALGKGFAWLLNWSDARENSRRARLQAWEDSLARREQDYRTGIEQQLAELKQELAAEVRAKADDRAVLHATRTALRQVTQRLRRYEPDSPEVAQAEALLRAGASDNREVLQLGPLPDDMQRALEEIRKRSE